MNKKRNFHTHTSRCHHAYGKDEEYVISAIENGYEVLGFSDHCSWYYPTGFENPRVRMKASEFDEYKKSILNLKEKYKDKIEIRLGLETEYFPEYMDWLLDFCIEKEIDYMVFGNHYYRSDEIGIYYGFCDRMYVQHYFDDCIAGMESGMYAYLAHPELIMRNPFLHWDKEVEQGFERVCQKAKELDMPLEYNVLGLQENLRQGVEMYPNSKFWQIASKYQNKAIIGMDAHDPMDLSEDLYELAYKNLSKYNVEIVNDIPKIDYKTIKKNKWKS